MKLITKEIEKKLPKLYSQEDSETPTMVICKFFHPCSNYTWYVTEGNKLENGDYTFFGYVVGQENELGYFNLSQLESVRFRGLGVERDRYFRPCPLSEVME